MTKKPFSDRHWCQRQTLRLNSVTKITGLKLVLHAFALYDIRHKAGALYLFYKNINHYFAVIEYLSRNDVYIFPILLHNFKEIFYCC